LSEKSLQDLQKVVERPSKSASRDKQLQALLRHPRIRTAGYDKSRVSGTENRYARATTIATGFAGLDRLLCGGWPRAALTEMLVEHYGCGEMSVLLPALQAESAGKGLIVWVCPPYLPYAPALRAAGIDLSRLVLVNAGNDNDALWSAEQALKSGACAAVFIWAEATRAHVLRRLQLAAEQNACWVVIFRPLRFMRQQSVAALRIQVSAHGRKLSLRAFKSRFGRPGSVQLSLCDA